MHGRARLELTVAMNWVTIPGPSAAAHLFPRSLMRTAGAITWLMLGWTALNTGCTTERPCSGPCGTIVVNVTGSPEAVLPVFTTSVNAQAVSELLFLPLAEIGDDLNFVGDDGFEPRVARSWAFEDSVTIVFALDPRATWQDGERVTARDVVFTYDLYRDPVVNSQARDDIASIIAVEARDERTVAFTFSHPYPHQFYDANYHMRIHPAHLLDTIPREALRSHELSRAPVGNGPYRLGRWDVNSTVELIADPDFFLGVPGLARIIVQVVPDLNTTVSQLIAEETDFTDFLGGPDNVERVRRAPHVEVMGFPSAAYAFVAFNFRDPRSRSKPHSLFGNRNIRLAITQALDREAIAEATVGEFGAVPSGPVSRANVIWKYAVPAIPFDTVRAREILESEGWTATDAQGYRVRNGQRLSFRLLVPTSSGLRRQAAIIMESQLRAVGVEMLIEELEFNAWQERSQRGLFDATFVISAQGPNPAGAIGGGWSSKGVRNWGRYSNSTFDSLLSAAGRIADPARNRAAWTEALRVLQQDVPAVWVLAPAQAAGVHDRLQDVFIRPDHWGATMWRWHVNADRMLPRDRVGIP